MSNASVLIVEDEWEQAEYLATGLRAAGYFVLEPALTRDAAIDAIARHHPSYALLDLTLEDETSFSIAEELESRGVLFLFLTGHNLADLPMPYRSYPSLCKPVIFKRLLTVMQHDMLLL